MVILHDLSVSRPEDFQKVIVSTGWVYFFERISDGAIKIGFTQSFLRRANELAKEHGSLTLLALLPAGISNRVICCHKPDMSLERRLHKKFERLAIGGEFFQPAADLLHFIRNVPKPSAFKRRFRNRNYDYVGKTIWLTPWRWSFSTRASTEWGYKEHRPSY